MADLSFMEDTQQLGATRVPSRSKRKRRTASPSASSRLMQVANPMLVGRVADTTAQRDREALDTSIVSLLQEFLDARAVSLYRVEDTENGARFVKRASVLKEGVQPLPEESRRDDCRKIFPVEDRGTFVGQLEVLSENPMTARDAVLVRGMLRVLRNQLALLDYGERDTLTGLLNRKTFETRFNKLTSRGASWLGLLDVDHFKSINDRYGHLFGDEVLLIISQIMKRTFRGADELFRFGGEEFVIVLEEADEEGARIAFDRLRAAVEAHVFPQAGQVTVSLGYTRVLPGDVPTTSVERADAALYYVKRNGRNSAQRYEALISSGQLEEKQRDGDIELF